MAKFVQWYNADGLRWCSSCQAYMSPDLFHRGQPKTPDGLQRHCRICRRTVRKAQYAAHRARDIAVTRAWQQAHPEQTLAAARRANRVYYRLHRRTPAQVAQMIERQEESA